MASFRSFRLAVGRRITVGHLLSECFSEYSPLIVLTSKPQLLGRPRAIFCTSCFSFFQTSADHNARAKGVPRIITPSNPKDEVPVIRVPQRMGDLTEKALRKKQTADDAARAERLHRNQRPLLIACKRPEFNFRLGSSVQLPRYTTGYKLRTPMYQKFLSIKLASQAWAKSKSAGDFFHIRPLGDHPSLRPIADDTPGFNKFPLHPLLLKGAEGFALPQCTQIQNEAIGMILHRDHVICAAETGSGKTLAYLLPILSQMLDEVDRRSEGRDGKPLDIPLNAPRGVILVPSRELAQQVYDVAVKLLQYTNLTAHVIIGGERTQLKLNRPGYRISDLVITTPGVMSKLLTNRIYKFSNVNAVVLDEVDTLLDDSFSETVCRLLSMVRFRNGEVYTNAANVATQSSEQQEKDEFNTLNDGAQLILVGATMPLDLKTILQNVIPVESLNRVSTSHLHRVQPHVLQTFLRINHLDKANTILRLIKEDTKAAKVALIFCNTSGTATWLAKFLTENGLTTEALHGDMAQKWRRGLFDRLKYGEIKCMVCTDIASRGLDTTFVDHVINYDFPRVVSDYIHRAGRVGRLGSPHKSKVTSLVSHKWEVRTVQLIEEAVRRGNEVQNVNANITRLINGRFGIEPREVGIGVPKERAHNPRSASIL